MLPNFFISHRYRDRAQFLGRSRSSARRFRNCVNRFSIIVLSSPSSVSSIADRVCAMLVSVAFNWVWAASNSALSYSYPLAAAASAAAFSFSQVFCASAYTSQTCWAAIESARHMDKSLSTRAVKLVSAPMRAILKRGSILKTDQCSTTQRFQKSFPLPLGGPGFLSTQPICNKSCSNCRRWRSLRWSLNRRLRGRDHRPKRRIIMPSSAEPLAFPSKPSDVGTAAKVRGPRIPGLLSWRAATFNTISHIISAIIWTAMTRTARQPSRPTGQRPRRRILHARANPPGSETMCRKCDVIYRRYDASKPENRVVVTQHEQIISQRATRIVHVMLIMGHTSGPCQPHIRMPRHHHAIASTPSHRH